MAEPPPPAAPPPEPGPALRPAPDPAPRPAAPRDAPARVRSRAPLIGVAALLVVVVCLRELGGVIAPVALAAVLVVAVAPLAGAVQRRGLPQWVGALTVVLASCALLLGLVAVLVVVVAELARVVPEYAGRIDDLVADASALLARAGVDPEQVRGSLAALGPGSLVGFLQGLLGQFLGLLSSLALLLTLLLFLGADAVSVPDRLRVVSRSRPDVVAALTGSARGTQRFLVVSGVFGLVIGVLDTIVLLLLGVPLAVPFGLLALVANFVPSVGFLIAMVPPALLALLAFGPGTALAVVAAFGVINIALQTIVQPRVIGGAVGLSVGVTFLSLVFWGWVLGPVGALLAVPLTLLATALLVDARPETRWLHALLASDPEGRAGTAADGA